MESYKNAVIPHGVNKQKTAMIMDMETACTFPSGKHVMPHCKGLLLCCSKCPSLVIQVEEYNWADKNMCPIISFHVYRFISLFKVHGRHS